MKLATDISLADAKAVLRAAFSAGEGMDCPCCGQLVKRYRRALSAGMAYGLILLARYDEGHPGEFVHLEQYFASLRNIPATVIAGGDVAKLRYWDLIEQMPAERDDGSWRIGYYRITDAGRDFVYAFARVASHVYLYNQKVLGFERTTVNIEEALGRKFNYRELMGMSW